MKVNCKYCGTEINKPPSHIKRSKNLFCDHDCYGKWLIGKESLKKHKIKVLCSNCGHKLEKAKWEIDLREMHFCDNKCRGEWRSKNIIGKDSASWKGGKAEYKNRSWYEKNIIDGILRRSTPTGKINHRMSNSIRKCLISGKGGMSWQKLVDYNLNDLKNHLEKLFKPGMTWDNINEWHIDHKIPIAAFNFTKTEHEDFKRCWALDNLQPLWATDNISKGAKVEKPFQKYLLL